MALEGLDPYLVKQRVEQLGQLANLGGAAADLGFLRRARRALLPLPVVDRPQRIDTDVFPPFRSRPIPALKGKRVAVIASGGSGACVSLVGVTRAFEEAGIEPAFISACSGGAIWGSMWAGGMEAQEMAEFSLLWRPEDYLDVQWLKLPGFLLSALRGFTGLAKGEAIEQLFDARLYGRTADALDIPIATIVWNMDLGRLEYFGSAETPGLPVGELVRTAIALPLFVEAVPVGDHLFVDGGIVDVFPAQPVLQRRKQFDHVFGVNFILPSKFEGEDITGWQDRFGGILKASRQLQQGNQLELARRSAEELGDQLTLIDATDHSVVEGVAFYDLFIDRARWPELIRGGYERATAALNRFRAASGARRPRRAAPSSRATRPRP